MNSLVEQEQDTHAPSAAALRQLLINARTRTLAVTGDLEGERLLGPRLTIVNPPLWEIGHLGWFQERWCLRYRGPEALAPSILKNADLLYDSSRVPHDARWDLPLPTLGDTLAYMRAVLERVCDRIENQPADTALAYFAQLAAFHEEMHCEAFTYTRQTLGYSAPYATGPSTKLGGGSLGGDVEIPGGEFMLGAAGTDAFVFDNEKWAHPVEIRPFRIARAAVTNSEFAAFVDDTGYARPELWSSDGWAWRNSAAAEHPVYWHGSLGKWLERRFDEIVSLAPNAPVMHVNWFEAEAYCRWAGRRLATEAEWEYAAASIPRMQARKRRYPWGDVPPDANRASLFGAAQGPVDVGALSPGDSAWGCRQMIGNVWEWTADAFGPYPGFVADPYKEYSEPWFGNHKVLRGGCYATRAELIRNTWRNFYTPDRRDVFAGFRTCAR